ncbi:MAG TPA: transcription termination factor Rho [Abditibacterium sp.]
MSPQEVSESLASTATTETAPAKPKRAPRRTTKAAENAEQPTLLADVAATPAPEKPKRAPRRTAPKTATKEAADTASSPTPAPEKTVKTPAPEVVTSPAPPIETARIETAPRETRSAAPAEILSSSAAENAPRDSAPRDSAPRDTQSRNFSAPEAPRETEIRDSESPITAQRDGNVPHNEFRSNDSRVPFSRDNAPRDNGFRPDSRGDRFAPRDPNLRDGAPREQNPRENTGRDNQNQFRDNTPRENGAPVDGAFPNAQNSGGEASNDSGFGGDRFVEGERGPDGRLRFRGGRNQMRRERNRGNDRDNRGNRFPNESGGFNPPQQNGRRREVDILGLRAMEMPELVTLAGEFNIETPSDDKETLIYSLLEAQAASQNAILKRGTLEILSDGKGFLRCDGYLPADGDVYVSQSQIKRFNLKTGDSVLGTVRTPKEMERFHGLLRVEAINGLSPEEMRTRKDFEKLTPIFPTEKFVLETEPTNITARIIDLVSPIGKGSRGLIVAPPKAGKTTLIKNIANSIATNHPDVYLIVLLIDERPEEVTDISRSIKGEVVASTFDEMPDNHMRVADIMMEKAKRMVEMKRDVVILMDSITRLSRASNLVVTPSGRTLSGGLDPAAMYRPKRMFGAARNIEEGGSLTILATALVDTGSRMDEMIFEEFKGTGNLDLVLDRNLFDQRIFPAIDINRSGTRRDDLLLGKEDLATVFHLRRTLAQLDNDKAVTLLIDRLKNTKSNLDFMGVVAKSARNAGNGAG